MNPYLLQLTLGFAAILTFRSALLKSLAVGYTHYTVQRFLIALAGDAPATGTLGLPLPLRFVFFPITVLPESYGVRIPFGQFLNSGVVGLAFFVIIRALNDQARSSGIQKYAGFPESWNRLAGNAPSESVNIHPRKQPVVDWVRTVQASTTEIQNTQNGARYWVSAGKMPWGVWAITVAAQGFLGMKRAVYSLCLVTPELANKLGGASVKEALRAGHIKMMAVSRFADADGTALTHVVSSVVQTAPPDE
jgi:hypothetical protein